jgi:hypothetical protein
MGARCHQACSLEAARGAGWRASGAEGEKRSLLLAGLGRIE